MYKVKYLNTITKLIEWRSYKGRDYDQVRAIANKMLMSNNLMWVGIYANEELEALR